MIELLKLLKDEADKTDMQSQIDTLRNAIMENAQDIQANALRADFGHDGVWMLLILFVVVVAVMQVQRWQESRKLTKRIEALEAKLGEG